MVKLGPPLFTGSTTVSESVPSGKVEGDKRKSVGIALVAEDLLQTYFGAVNPSWKGDSGDKNVGVVDAFIVECGIGCHGQHVGNWEQNTHFGPNTKCVNHIKNVGVVDAFIVGQVKGLELRPRIAYEGSEVSIRHFRSKEMVEFVDDFHFFKHVDRVGLRIVGDQEHRGFGCCLFSTATVNNSGPASTHQPRPCTTTPRPPHTRPHTRPRRVSCAEAHSTLSPPFITSYQNPQDLPHSGYLHAALATTHTTSATMSTTTNTRERADGYNETSDNSASASL
ncbi:hypothetical protein C8R45DRAFT_938454 [Mycena sanguinolenta]|nr:hypothetical protein C8R45DRAFT_938454 [Mycena sanguinolenta]